MKSNVEQEHTDRAGDALIYQQTIHISEEQSIFQKQYWNWSTIVCPYVADFLEVGCI